MHGREVSFSDHAPVYRQISQLLRQQVGVEWRVGEPIPSEEQLAEDYNVTRVTLRRAVSILVDEGLLQRRRGQPPVVTDFARPPKAKFEADPSSLFQVRSGTQFKVLQCERVPLPVEAIEQLEISPKEHGYRVDRLLDEGGEYLAYVLAYLPEEIGGLLDPAKMKSKTLTAQLTSDCGLMIEYAEQYVEAVLADVLVGPALSVPLGSPILKCRYVLRDEKRRPVLVASYFYRADRYRLALEIETTQPRKNRDGTRIDSWPMRTIVTENKPSVSPRTKRGDRKHLV